MVFSSLFHYDFCFSSQNPVPKKPWSGLLNGKMERLAGCAQKNILRPNATFDGEEDCLYLNIYRPTVSHSFVFNPPKKQISQSISLSFRYRIHRPNEIRHFQSLFTYMKVVFSPAQFIHFSMGHIILWTHNK